MSQKNKSIQEKMTELTDIVSWFNGDSFVLESATDKFKEAEKKAQEIEDDLSKLKNEINVVKQRFDGAN